MYTPLDCELEEHPTIVDIDDQINTHYSSNTSLPSIKSNEETDICFKIFIAILSIMLLSISFCSILFMLAMLKITSNLLWLLLIPFEAMTLYSGYHSATTYL